MKTPRRIRLAVLIMCLAAVSGNRVCADSLSAERISDLFSQAKELFRKANNLAASDPGAARDLYHKAAMRFERIAREGQVRNGKLYYNIGNAYLRTGDIGRAVLYYRRASLLIPNDQNLHQNLSYARSKCIDKIEEKQQAKVFKTLFFWHYDLSSRLRLYVFTATFAMLWIVASVRLLYRRLSPRWAIAILAVVTALLSGSLLVETLTAGSTVSGVVLAPEVVARKGDGKTYEPSFKTPLHAGTEFAVLEDRGEWHYAELADGRRCWLPTKAVGIVQRLGTSVETRN
ncbi:MAG: hypothetical protein J7M14_06760 [Planctomycetes bacterium]|nr:hypothetical protein [Planctomycetota bacterium]